MTTLQERPWSTCRREGGGSWPRVSERGRSDRIVPFDCPSLKKFTGKTRGQAMFFLFGRSPCVRIAARVLQATSSQPVNGFPCRTHRLPAHCGGSTPIDVKNSAVAEKRREFLRNPDKSRKPTAGTFSTVRNSGGSLWTVPIERCLIVCEITPIGLDAAWVVRLGFWFPARSVP